MSNSTQSVLAKVTEAFNFTVDKFPLSGPEGMRTPCYGLFRSDTGEFLGGGNNSVTKRYVPHTTDDVLAICEAADSVFDGTANVSCHFQRGHYVSVTPSANMRLNIFGTADNIFPRLMIRGGYGGNGGAFKVSLGFYRDLCKNLSMLQTVKALHKRLIHNGNLRDNMDYLISTVGKLREGWESMFTAVQRMEENEVHLDAFLDRIYGTPDADATQRQVTIHRKRTREIMTRVLQERALAGRPQIDRDTFKITGWEAYNAVQGYTQHKATRKGNPSDFARIIAASQSDVVKQAEILALAS